MTFGSGDSSTTSAAVDPSLRRLMSFEAHLLDRVDAAVLATDLNGLVVYANRAAEALFGVALDELVGHNSSELSAGSIPQPVQREIGAALASGGTWEGDFDIRRRDGSAVTVHAVDSPLYDQDGALAGVVSLAMDITDRRRSEQAEHFLLEAMEVLASTLDYHAAFENLARLAVPYLADLCLIDVEESGAIRRMAAVHADPAKTHLVRALVELYPPDVRDDHPAVRVIRTGVAELSAAMPPDFLLRTTRDAEHLRIVTELGFTSYMSVPLVARNRRFGALTLVSAGSGRAYGPRDLALAKDLAHRAALTIDNARLFSERTHIARTLQASLLPPSLPLIRGIELAARYQAAGQGNEVGGDFYDVFDAGYGTWVVAIGDVCGKGPEAAALTGLARHTLRAAAIKERKPDRLLDTLNTALSHTDIDDETFATVCCGLLRPAVDSARLTVSSGGHPLPLIVRAADGRVEIASCRGSLLGAMPGPTFSTAVVVLAPGDLVVFYTDGVTEAHRDDTLFGEDRLVELLRQCAGMGPAEVADRILQAVSTFSDGEPRDDLAVLAFRVAVLGG